MLLTEAVIEGKSQRRGTHDCYCSYCQLGMIRTHSQDLTWGVSKRSRVAKEIFGKDQF